MTLSLPRGVYPPLLTFYDERERLDHEAIAAHAQALVAAGAQGLVVAGSTGEFHLLDGAERRATLETVVTACGSSVTVLAHVGAPTTRETCELAEHAAQAGAAGVMAITPYYLRTDDDGLVAHVAAITHAVPDLPLLAYSMPRMAGTSWPLPLVLRLAEQGLLSGVKESGDELGRLLALLGGSPDRFAAFAGAAPLLAPTVLAGGHGGILALANVVPELLVAVFEAARAGDGARALGLSRALLPLADAIREAGPAPTGMRAAVAARWGLPEHARRPLLPVGDARRRAVAATLERLLTSHPC